MKVWVPRDAAAKALGAEDVVVALEAEATRRGIDLTVIRNGSRGMVWLEPLVELETPEGRVGFGPFEPADVPALFDVFGAHLKALGLVEEDVITGGSTFTGAPILSSSRAGSPSTSLASASMRARKRSLMNCSTKRLGAKSTSPPPPVRSAAPSGRPCDEPRCQTTPVRTRTVPWMRRPSGCACCGSQSDHQCLRRSTGTGAVRCHQTRANDNLPGPACAACGSAPRQWKVRPGIAGADLRSTPRSDTPAGWQVRPSLVLLWLWAKP